MGEEPTRKEAAECLRDLGNRKFERLADAQQYLERLQETVMQLVPQVRVRVCACVCVLCVTSLSSSLPVPPTLSIIFRARCGRT